MPGSVARRETGRRAALSLSPSPVRAYSTLNSALTRTSLLSTSSLVDSQEALSRGIYNAYVDTNLRYSQVSPVDMFTEANTGCNLPAQIDLFATNGSEYKFLFMAKGGGSANKSFLYQQTKALLNEKSLEEFLREKMASLGTAACPPYHLSIVIGGTSAEQNLKTVKLGSAKVRGVDEPWGRE